jgi:hypothetical protein
MIMSDSENQQNTVVILVTSLVAVGMAPRNSLGIAEIMDCSQVLQVLVSQFIVAGLQVKTGPGQTALVVLPPP